jgi:hypothetical protein
MEQSEIVGFEVFNALVMKSFIFCLALFATCARLVSCLAYSFSMKLEARCSSETSADFQRTTWRYIREDRNLQMKYIKGLLSFWPLPIVWYSDMTQCFGKWICFRYQVNGWGVTYCVGYV